MNFGFAPFLAILIFCCARYDFGVSRLMSLPWIVLCGEASYSLYLGHFVIIDAFRYETAVIANDYAWQLTVASFLRLAVVIMASIGMALVSWKLIEVPSRRWMRKLLQAKPAAALANEVDMNAAGEYVNPAVPGGRT